MAKLFLSYRRADGVAAGARSAIYQRLEQHYGPRRVFMDVERMQVARDFRESLRDEVVSTDAVLVLIGPDWERLMIERSGDDADFVRMEIEVALAHDIAVLPILLGEGTKMPLADNVPKSIRAFTFNHGVQLDTGRFFNQSMDRLIQDMDEHLFAGMASYKPKPQIFKKWGLLAGVIGLAALGWYVAESLKDTSTAVQGLNDDAREIGENTAKIADAMERVGATFEELAKAGGVIEKPVAPYEFYHNARIFELRGDYVGARKAYLSYFQFNEEKLDPHLRYLDFLKVQEGREGARENYALIANRDASSVSRYAAMLLWDRDRRIELLREFEKGQPQFAPVYYHLSLEFSRDRLGNQSIEDQRTEKKYLEQFQTQDQAGQLVKHFVDQEIVTAWREDAGKRLKALGSMADSVLENPVSLTWMTSGSGWHGHIQIAEAATEVFWKTTPMSDFKQNPKTTNIDTRTGQPRPDSGFVLPLKQSATTIEVKYVDQNGALRGPYKFTFNPQTESWANDIRILNMLPTSWLSFRDYEGELLVYFSHVMGYRGALTKIEYGIDTDEPNQEWLFPVWDKAGIAPIGPEVAIHRSVPLQTKFMTVRLSYKDGTVSEVVRFEK